MDAGFQVELVEAEPQFGGRATSWIDPTDGQKIESGIHSFFGINSRLSSILQEVGVNLDQMVAEAIANEVYNLDTYDLSQKPYFYDIEDQTLKSTQEQLIATKK